MTATQQQQRQAATAAAASPEDERAKSAWAVLCVEGAGNAECNGYYKIDGAPAPPSVIANDDTMIMMIVVHRCYSQMRYYSCSTSTGLFTIDSAIDVDTLRD